MSDNSVLARLEGAMATAVEQWPTVRQSGGQSYADGAVAVARAALATYAQAVERMREKPREVIVVRVPSGRPRLRASRIMRGKR